MCVGKGRQIIRRHNLKIQMTLVIYSLQFSINIFFFINFIRVAKIPLSYEIWAILKLFQR